MPHISYHASHEQFAPSELLQYAQLAEKAGFTACHSSDHFHPWGEKQGHSGFSLAWLGAAMQATSFPYSLITAPGQRYHPAIVAQAIATLLEMFPERLEIALGSGEAVNEAITGEEWPSKPERNARLWECADVIKRLLKGEQVSHSGRVQVKEAKIYSLPLQVPGLLCAALSEETAKWAGSWADGLLTVHQAPEKLQKVMEAFKSNGGEGKPIHVQMAFSYARDKEFALESAYEQWRNNLIGVKELADFTKVKEFDERGAAVSKKEFEEKMPVSTDLHLFTELIRQDLALGADNVILHNVNKDQKTFIEDFGKQVIPVVLQGNK